jgi:hypothetical protein
VSSYNFTKHPYGLIYKFTFDTYCVGNEMDLLIIVEKSGST